MMTERTFSIPPQIATPIQSAIHVGTSNTVRDALAPAESIEEEPYTIKCICDYSDDDGNTILCERCDTWQHIECFYHGNIEEASADDFRHLCHECQPRSLDRRKATERQRQQRLDRPLQNNGEKKTKRPSSKSHKKKPKSSDPQTNGYHNDHDVGHKNGNSHEHSHTHKKSKSIHRSHNSISSQNTKQAPAHSSRTHTHAHPLSPATTPPDDFLLHSYSKQLQDLYENDPGPQELKTNSFASLSVTDTMSLWLRDPNKLREDAGVVDPEDAFQQMKPEFNFGAHVWPRLQVNTKEIVANEAIIPLRYLSLLEPLRQKNTLVGELKGFVGLQKNYYDEETDHFSKLCHPAPFVFFHPTLPLYIDTRREGSQCRYIRRSCRPNTTLDTYITNKVEYHFCIVNERPLASNEQVTLAWDFKFKVDYCDRYLHLLGLSDEDDSAKQPEASQVEYDDLTELIRNVLSEYGGCACGLDNDCAFARFHRNYRGKMHAQSIAVKPKKGRKPKQHISPTSTGQATNSRDVSEGRQEVYDGEDDSRSNSGSARSKPHSRDMTPFTPGDGIPATSEREKRKVADIEKAFQMLDQTQPVRKKKRTSDGPVSTSPVTTTTAGSHKTKQKPAPRASISNASSTLANGPIARYKDASTSRQHSHSPTVGPSPKITTPVLPEQQFSGHRSVTIRSRQSSIAPRNNYVNHSTQTDEVDNAWYSGPTQPVRKRVHVPLSKRLLNNQMKVRAERESRRASQQSQMMEGIDVLQITNPLGLDAKPLQNVNPVREDGGTDEDHQVDGVDEAKEPINTEAASADIIMADAPPSITESTNKSSPPWPGGALNPVSANPSAPPSYRLADLKARLSPVQLFSNSSQPMGSTASESSTTSTNSTGFISQSPYGSVNFQAAFSPSINGIGQHPSPVRKKLSLGAYHAMKKKAPESTSISNMPVLDSISASAVPQLALAVKEEAKKPVVLDVPAIVESPVGEGTVDGLAEVSIHIGDIPDQTPAAPAPQL